MNDEELLLFNELVCGGILKQSCMTELHVAPAHYKAESFRHIDGSMSSNPVHIVCLH